MKNLFRKICIASVFTMMLPTAFAVDASPVVEISTVDAQSQSIIIDKIPVKAKNIQLTINLTKEQAYDFILNSVFNQPGIELFVKALDEDSVTVYLTSNSSELTTDGKLELGSVNSSDVFNIESISDLKITDGENELGYWPNVGKPDKEPDDGDTSNNPDKDDSDNTDTDGDNSNDNSSDGASSSGSSSSNSGNTSSSAKKYAINIVTNKTFGSINVNNNSAKSGDTVIFYARPLDGYFLKQVFVEDNAGKRVELTQVGDNKFSFNMPSKDVIIEALFEKTVESNIDDELITKMPFTDIMQNDWSYDAIKYVYDNGIMNGISNTLFLPKNNTSRAMLVTMLYRLDSSLIDSQYKSKFSDIDKNSYYEDAVKWAEKNNIISGYSSDKFGPHNNITREQLATVLYRYAKYKNINIDYKLINDNKFNDIRNVGEYAVDAVNWAISCDILQGVNDDKLDPQGFATREQIATIFMRFMQLSE